MAFNILILGASYGSLLGAKFVLAGHNVTLVCLPAEVAVFNSEGARVRLPIKGREGLVEIDTRNAPGKLRAAGPDEVDPAKFDLVALAMQEPQYSAPGVRTLLSRVAKSGVPCMSIMNMPPLPYMARIPGVSMAACQSSFTESAVWADFDPALMTLCSPDPQAFRPPDEKVNVLQVRLPTNFKAARFVSDKHTDMLRKISADVEAVRFNDNGKMIELPVKLKVHDSVFVPLAKWSMLMCGNYRCIQKDGMRPIKDAVHGNIDESRAVYQWVFDLCVSLGADANDLVPFEKYANAAVGLANPSSAARALFGGAPNIERVDRLVQSVAAQKGMKNAVIDEIVLLVDSRLELNRANQPKS